MSDAPTTAPEPAAADSAPLRLVRGRATPEELAAVVAVLAAAGGRRGRGHPAAGAGVGVGRPRAAGAGPGVRRAGRLAGVGLPPLTGDAATTTGRWPRSQSRRRTPDGRVRCAGDLHH